MTGASKDGKHGKQANCADDESARLPTTYLTVLDRKVKITESNGEAKELHFDVVGHPRWHFSFACVLPFHTAKGDQPAEVGKHGNIEGCAAAELSEEVKRSAVRRELCSRLLLVAVQQRLSAVGDRAMLTGGELVRLIPDGHPGYAEVKWCANRFTPFLVIDPQVDPDPGARDAEEYIEVLRVPVPELRRLLVSGDMMLPSIVTANLALAVLESRGLL
ncbi:hypothetical protein QJQ45_003867 [Haematococcus lacustris]|nr:hypothetical protein QJQ45_003867 [Haematococcus lacustris]